MTSSMTVPPADDGARPAWWLYRGDGRPPAASDRLDLPTPPPWRKFDGEPEQPPPPQDDEEAIRKLGRPDVRPVRSASVNEADMVNAAIRLSRPLLVTGNPGIGKSSLAFRIARELGLGRVLQWPVTSQTTLRSGLYEYDAIGRVHAIQAGERASIGEFVTLGPLGTALLAYARPRVLLVDELDKSDVDLPNDLLHIFETGTYPVPELVRMRQREPAVTVNTADPNGTAVVHAGRVGCWAFPIVVITSNGEREFPPAFLRRCLRLDLSRPTACDLAAMVQAQLPTVDGGARELIDDFLNRPATDTLALDQLLNAVYLTTSGVYAEDRDAWRAFMEEIWRSLSAET